MKKFYLVLLSLISSVILCAQVGINTNAPHALTELDVKNIVNGSDTIPKGVLIPRLRTKQRDQMPISDANKDNGILIYNIDEDCYNYYNHLEKEWKSICGKASKSVFTIDCSNIQVNGEYQNGIEMNSSNFISITVNVTKRGTYSISAVIADSNKENGYFFVTSGEFLSEGTYNLHVPAMGTPIKYSNPDKDKFTIDLNGIKQSSPESACTFEVEVKNSTIRPRYTMSCEGTAVYGEYYEESALNASNYIEVVLNVDPTSFGATYVIETNEVDGIHFKGSGTLTSNPQTVRLQGVGTPYKTSTKSLYVRSNSESSASTCIAEVWIIIPPKRILTIGTDTGYGYNLGTVGTASNKLITDPFNFGPKRTSIVHYSGFTNKGTGATSNEGVDDGRTIISRNANYFNTSTRDGEFHDLLFGTETYPAVDILYIGWTTGIGVAASQWDGITENQLNDINDFVHKGGILLMFSEAPVLNKKIFRKIFGKDDIDFVAGTGTNPAGSVYRYPTITDPILDGPFGNLTGLYWGEDASITNYATKLPLDEVVLYSNNVNVASGNKEIMNAATSFRHRTLPFVWVGDGGFTSSGGAGATICPFALKPKTIKGTVYPNFPSFKSGYGAGTIPGMGGAFQVYNAVFAANAIAWCIETAEEYKRAQKE